MAFFLGNHGAVAFRRGTEGQSIAPLQSAVNPDDISTTLNRVGFDKALDNLITGDRIDLSTTDSRGLAFIPSSNWSSGVIEDSFSAFINVNEAGGLRFFLSFSAAVNNDRSQEIALQTFTGNPISVSARLIDAGANTLGNVFSYEFNATREAIDTTTLSDYFRTQYNAGLLSGSGRMECGFDYSSNGVIEPPLAVMQTIQRLDLGCAFDAYLYLTDEEITPNTKTVFYQVTAVVTQVGITVSGDSVINATIDFVTTGSVRLIFARPSEYILKEDTDRIQVEQGVDFLLKEVAD
jgi:hypothetical protein